MYSMYVINCCSVIYVYGWVRSWDDKQVSKLKYNIKVSEGYIKGNITKKITQKILNLKISTNKQAFCGS